MSHNPPEAASAVSVLPDPKTNPDPLLTEQEAAEFLGIKPATLAVWRAVKRYPLPYVKIGSRVRYRKSALQAFADSRTQGAEGGES